MADQAAIHRICEARAVRRLVAPKEAEALVIDHTAALPSKSVPIAGALGCVLAEDVRADRDQPPFDRAAMDGFAVRLADAGRTVPVAAEIAAGSSPEAALLDGTCVEIMTGAPCPPGTEAVVKVEDTKTAAFGVVLPSSIRRGQHIVPAGTECASGRVVAERGQPVSPLVVANLAAFGIETVCVIRRPSVAVITTGDELAPPGSNPSAAQIRDSNGPMLVALARTHAAGQVTCDHAGDTEAALCDAIIRASQADVVILSGGVSAGRYDLVPQALARATAQVVFHGVSQKPGKPTLFATRGSQLVFALPGTPLGAHLGFHRLVRAALRTMTGRSAQSVVERGVLTGKLDVRPTSRTLFVLARARAHPDGWVVDPLSWRGSSDIYGPCSANCYVRLPPRSTGAARGSVVDIEWITRP